MQSPNPPLECVRVDQDRKKVIRLASGITRSLLPDIFFLAGSIDLPLKIAIHIRLFTIA